MRVLHFVPDEKFIPFVQQMYGAAFPGQNRYRVDADPGRPARFVTPDHELSIEGPAYWRGDAVRAEMELSDCVIAHYMTPSFIHAIRRAPAGVMVVWSGWGADYYDLLEPLMGPLVLPATLAASRRVTPRRTRLNHFLRKQLKRAMPGRSVRSIAGRLDVVSVNPAEVELFRRALPQCRAVHHHLPYYSTESTFEPGPAMMQGPDILLGNSATPENNHVEALTALARSELGERRVFVPLSYGIPAYADQVCALGKSLLGDRFVPLRRYMTLDEYHDAIASCGTVLMNHVRQQAVGTISTALYKGAVVVLRPENPVSSFYLGMGVEVRTAGDVDTYDAQLGAMDDVTRARNREIVGAFWAQDRVIDEMRKLAVFQVARAASRGAAVPAVQARA